MPGRYRGECTHSSDGIGYTHNACRRFRQWRGEGNSIASLPALTTPTEATGADRTLSADTWSVRGRHEVGGATKSDDFEFVWKDRDVWNQESSVHGRQDSHQDQDGADVAVTETAISGDGGADPLNDSSDQSIGSAAAQVDSQHTEESMSVQEREKIYDQQNTSSCEIEPQQETMTEQSLTEPSSTAQTKTSTPRAGAKAVAKQLSPPATQSLCPAVPKTRGSGPVLSSTEVGKTRGSRPVLSSTEVGKGLFLNPNTRDANVRRKVGREDMYPAMTPGPLVRPPFNSQTRTRGDDMNGMFCTSDGVCGVRSMTLQSAEKRWVKPAREQRAPRARNSEPVSSSTRRPPTTPTVETQEEGKLLRFSTVQSLQCEVTEPACPVKTVDSLIDLLSQGMVSEATPPLTEEGETEESAVSIEITPELVHTVHSVLRSQLTPYYLETKGINYPDNSFINSSDVESLLRAAEFRSECHTME